MAFVPYLHFPGTCSDAIRFYAAAFGTQPPEILLYRDAPEGPPDWKDSNRVIHARLEHEGGELFASDFPPGIDDKQQAVSVSHDAPNADAARSLFDKLSEGGEVLMKFGPTFFAPAFGMVRDRFGTHWMIGVRADREDD